MKSLEGKLVYGFSALPFSQNHCFIEFLSQLYFALWVLKHNTDINRAG